MRYLRLVPRLLGWLLMIGAIVMLAREAWGWWAHGAWAFIPAGELWFELHPDSLQLVQPAIERHLWVFLWNPLLFTLLQFPAWAVLAVPGLLLAFGHLLRRRGQRRMFGPRR